LKDSTNGFSHGDPPALEFQFQRTVESAVIRRHPQRAVQLAPLASPVGYEEEGDDLLDAFLVAGLPVLWGGRHPRAGVLSRCGRENMATGGEKQMAAGIIGHRVIHYRGWFDLRAMLGLGWSLRG
jgi:hypothetical protein